MNRPTMYLGLDIHHRDEDAHMFASLGDRRPKPASPLATPRAEHEVLEDRLDFEEKHLVPPLDSPNGSSTVAGRNG
jgi:hypothetical protein